MGQHYKEIAAIALKRREEAIPKDLLLPESALSYVPQNLTTVPRSSGHFSAQELAIIESDAEDILLKIRERTWTSLEVTKAFCKAAVVAQQLVSYTNKSRKFTDMEETNCLTEILFPEALARAKFLDEHQD